MNIRKLINFILGPSRKMVEREIEIRKLTKVTAEEAAQRKILRARLLAIEASLPPNYRHHKRGIDPN